MTRSAALGLAAIVIGSIAVRLSPLWSFLYWGSDTGEYFAIAKDLLRTQHVSTTYSGWGVTYPYFPGMFFLQGGLVGLGGLDLPTVLNLLMPVLGAFAVVPVFLIGHRVSGEASVALFAAGVLAGAIPHVYTTAHAAPATLGDLLALTGLVLFLRLRVDGRSMVPLLLVTAALIATHHLSLYFFLLMVFGTILIRGFVAPWRATSGSKREVVFAGILLIGTFAYWLGYATAFREYILPDVSIQPWWALLVVFAMGLVLLAALVRARAHVRWRYRPRYPGLPYRGVAYGAAVGTIFVIGLVSVVSGVPGTTFRVPAADLLYFVPLVLLISLAAVGRKFLDFLKDGIAPTAWIVALVGSATMGILAAPRVLIPYRHMEYLVVPFAIIAGVGVVRVIHLAGLRGAPRTAFAAVVGSLLFANVLAGLPPATALAGWREGTLPTALDAAYWARDHVDGLVVTDHHASTTIFGFGGLNATWDRARAPFSDPVWNPTDFIGIESPSGRKNGTYVWIDRDMEAGVRLTPWETAAPMDPAVIAKFDDAPLVKVFDNGYARVYWIAWGCTPSTC
jgi:hypothetical protein